MSWKLMFSDNASKTLLAESIVNNIFLKHFTFHTHVQLDRLFINESAFTFHRPYLQRSAMKTASNILTQGSNTIRYIIIIMDTTAHSSIYTDSSKNLAKKEFQIQIEIESNYFPVYHCMTLNIRPKTAIVTLEFPGELL